MRKQARAYLKTHGSELEVASTASDCVNSLRTKLGVSSWAAQLVLSLLVERDALSASSAALVLLITTNS